MRTRMLEDEELRVALGHCAHAQKRIGIGPLVPARNLEPLGEPEPGWQRDYVGRPYRDARAVAVGVMSGLVLAVGALIIMGWWLS